MAFNPCMIRPRVSILWQVEVAHKFSTPKTLVQQYLFIPAKHKDCYLTYVLNEFAGQSTIVFVSTCNNAQVRRGIEYRKICVLSRSLLLRLFYDFSTEIRFLELILEKMKWCYDPSQPRILSPFAVVCLKRVALLLRNLGFQAVCLHGQMGQPKRLGALGKFKSGQRNVLIATDVASRGLDIPSVSAALNGGSGGGGGTQ